MPLAAAGVVEAPLELENQIAVERVRIAPADAQRGDVFLQENRLGRLQPRKDAAQELQKQIAN